jgi:hypothetical protein
MFMQYGILRYDAFMLSNIDVPMEGFANIASVVSANQDEEVWIESIYYRDRQHVPEEQSPLRISHSFSPYLYRYYRLLIQIFP